jgi:hypothetical protein
MATSSLALATSVATLTNLAGVRSLRLSSHRPTITSRAALSTFALSWPLAAASSSSLRQDARSLMASLTTVPIGHDEEACLRHVIAQTLGREPRQQIVRGMGSALALLSERNNQDLAQLIRKDGPE